MKKNFNVRRQILQCEISRRTLGEKATIREGKKGRKRVVEREKD